MNIKKLIVFLLFAFLPMVAVGLVMHFSGASTVDVSADPSTIDQAAVLKGFIMSAGSMLIPLLAVIFTQLIFKEPVLKGLGISFKFNRWWWIGWFLMPVIAMLTLGVTLLMPGAKWTPDGETVQQALQSLPEGFGVEIDTSTWKMPPIFRLLQEWGGVEWPEMYRTFNMGIGMILMVGAKEADAVTEALDKAGEKSYRVGRVTRSDEVVLKGGVFHG